MVFSPHPDDESLGCGGLIATLTDSGQDVFVIFVSDGAMSHANSLAFDRESRIALRREEAVIACELLGVPGDRLLFMDQPDGAVVRQWEPHFAEVVTQVVDQLTEWQADTLVVPWRRDPHADHRATWEICREAARVYDPEIRFVEYPIWMWEATHTVDLPRAEEMIVWQLDISTRIERKEAAIQTHASQLNRLIYDDPEGFFLQEHVLAHFRHPREIFFEDAGKRHRSLPGAYFDRVYAASDDPWNFSSSDYERAKYAATLAALPRRRYASGFEIGCSIGVLTELIADRCDRLLAVDTSGIALDHARERLGDRPSVRCVQMVIPAEFPEETFDLIVLSEVGYYWGYDDLELTIGLIQRALRPGGTLILVHYTPYVPDYPLTGDEVHQAFARGLTGFHHPHTGREERYRLDVWVRKGSEGGPNA